MNRRQKFSLGWCVGVTILHSAVTLLLALLIFTGGMASFTYAPGAAYYASKTLIWIWSPFAMASAAGSSGINFPTEGIAMIWSVIVGALAGFIAPIFSKPKIQKPLPPGINPDLIGTPWEQKTQIKFPTLVEASAKEQGKEPDESL